MKDKRFVEEMVSRIEQAREKSKTGLSGLSFEQLNWKFSPESWSIGQCLDHLVVSDLLYFPQLKKISENKFHMSFWQRFSPFSGLFGKMLVSQVGEIPKKKMNAPKVLRPTNSEVDPGIFERFYKHLDSLQDYISADTKIDIDRIKITSPVSGFITYSLRNAILLLVQHEHRHLNQAIKVRQLKEFPAQ